MTLFPARFADGVTGGEWLLLAVALAVGVLAVARFTRLIVHDDFPPVLALRDWWFNHTVAKGGWRAGWGPLIAGEQGTGCPFCFAPWVTLVDLTWAAASDLHGWWWLANLWFAAAYLAAMVVVRDEPPAED